MYIKPVPVTYLPLWCKLYGLQISVMEDCCQNYSAKDRLPRGLEKRLEGRRDQLIKALENISYSFHTVYAEDF